MQNPYLKPPRRAEKIMEHISWPDDRDAILDNLQEDFQRLSQEKGRTSARRWYWRYVIKSIWPWLRTETVWRNAMFFNHLKIAFRQFRRQLTFSIINVTGLAMGMACCMLILLWVQDELGYERCHENVDRIQCIVNYSSSGAGRVGRSVVSPLVPYLRDNYADIEFATRYRPGDRRLFNVNDQPFYEEGGAYVDPEFFDIFTARAAVNDPREALKDQNTLVMTESMARRCFGGADPIGRVVTLDNAFKFQVGAVVADCAPNSIIQYDYLLPFDSWGRFEENDLSANWGWHANFNGFVVLRPGVDAAAFSRQIEDVMQTNGGREDDYKLRTFPLARLHVHGLNGEGAGRRILLFSSIGLLILLMACINFINLTTAQSARRAREIALRKVSGAGKEAISRQIFAESAAIVMLAAALGIVLTVLLLPVLNGLSGKTLELDWFGNPVLMMSFASVMLVTALTAGLYPAVFFASFTPLKVLRSSRVFKSSHSTLRKVLVVMQFAISMILLVATLVIHSQMHFVRTRELGFDKDHLIYINLEGKLRTVDRSVIMRELGGIPGVNGVTVAQSLPNYAWNTSGSLDWDGRPEQVEGSMPWVSVNNSYFETVGIDFIEGETFKAQPSNRELREFIINEKALEYMQIENPVGKSFTMWDRTPGRIVGVVKNVHNAPLYENIYPVFYVQFPYFYQYIVMNVNAEHLPAALEQIQEAVENINPDYPFEFHFVDDFIDEQYETDRQAGTLVSCFAAVAVLIACLGLLGLSLYMAQQRTREIGIRKTLGASVPGIVRLVSGDFLKLVLVSNVIAWPVAWYFMRDWLMNFAYRTSLHIGIFILSASVGLAIAFLTISLQAVKAARANLVESLRYE